MPNREVHQIFVASNDTFDKLGNLWIGTAIHGVAVFKEGGIITGNQNQSAQLTPKEFKLEQNYPNPFNPVTTIKFNLTQDPSGEMQDVKLVIYDMIGREVKTLVNEKLSHGTYEFKFDGNNFSSGFIFIHLLLVKSTVIQRR